LWHEADRLELRHGWDPAEAAQQALTITQHGKVVALDGSEVALHADTVCIHGDTPGSPKIAAQVAKSLREAGFAVSPLTPTTPTHPI
jgi:UPF0271 protein